jgi:hypothetical protein
VRPFERMEETKQRGADRSDAVDQPQFGNYLPGMPRLSHEPGRLERFLGSLLRPRGTLRVVRRQR